ncbi:Rad17 cell cycle checkpoint protein-domain-containing protein [Aspergillus avenaceus]|uniref:Rad17 cell cycle checkpoint protein-domain-containing protein n=1 Tax=Aspergillus avenaceus TaxID=36643 RepID=A0A5N6THD3_ASPAV|nr:Rad17 cell cycle checkpoint protein-domain-containing protein [Aspergillus avenaceus]
MAWLLQPTSPNLKQDSRRRNERKTSGLALNKLLGPVGAEQRWPSQKPQTRRSNAIAEELRSSGSDDIIDEAYDSFDEIFMQHFTSNESVAQDTPRDRSFPPDSPRRLSPKQSMGDKQKFAGTHRRFLLDPVSNLKAPGTFSSPKLNQKLPWALRYPPANLDELAVNKKKVLEVRSWLSNAFMGNVHRLLVLRGPAGSGKTTTVSLLSEMLGFDILEWKSPPPLSDVTTKQYVSISGQFEDFLGRGNKFRRLELDGDSSGSLGRPVSAPQAHRRIILIEEYPSSLNRSSSSLIAFRESIQRHLATVPAKPFEDPHQNGTRQYTSSPIVLVVSESQLNSGHSENLTVYRLLGPELYNHPNTAIIDFNSIAPTFMHKALKLILEKEARDSRRDREPGTAILQSMCQSGDIRSAVSSLELLCLNVGEWGVSGTQVKKQSRKNAILTSIEKETLRLITQREASLGIFHAIGKIMYNKRDDTDISTGDLGLPPPPDHLRHHDRPKASQVHVDELMEEMGTDVQIFLGALHENYVPSCHSPSFTDCVDACIGVLSDSDMLCVDHRGLRGPQSGSANRVNSLSSSVDMMRQEEIGYQVAVRGLLFALPYPVRRYIGPAQLRETHKMFFPSMPRLMQEIEEVQGLVNIYARSMLDPFNRKLWNSLLVPRSSMSAKICSTIEGKDHGNQAPVVTMLSRDELLLYQLPYLAKIHCNEVAASQLKRVIRFHRTGYSDSLQGVRDQDSDESNLAHTCTEHDDTPQTLHLKFKDKSKAFGPRRPPEHEDDDEKLILSDDDIVDDM